MTPYPPQYPYPPHWPQPQKPRRARLGNTLALVGGLVAGVSFFLPFLSLLGIINVNLFSLATEQPPVSYQVFCLLPPLVACAVVLSCCLTFTDTPSSLSFYPFTLSLVGLVLVGLLLLSVSGTPSIGSLAALSNYLGPGCYGLALGFLAGCVGSALELVR